MTSSCSRLKALRIAGALVRPTALLLPWGAVFGSALFALPLLYLFRPGPFDSPWQLMTGVRLGAVLFAVGAAFLWDEPARALTDPAPVRLLHRRLVRVALYVPCATAAWMVVLGLASFMAQQASTGNGDGARAATSIPLLALTLEVVAMTVGALALAGLISGRIRGMDTGVVTSPLVLVLAAATAVLPGRFAMMLTDPTTDRWAQVNRRWWWVLAGSVIALVLASRDPGARRIKVG